METFAIRNLSFSYPEQEAKAIDDLSLSVGQGEFVVLCGPSGCGKSTLLRQLKTVLAPHGRRTGEILFEGTALDELDQRTQSQKIGFVQQSPENQVVTDKVWHELAFGLESLGCDTPTIRRKVAEMASFFGIQTWFYKNVTELSGGQKQLLNLASVMVMQPEILILDEPTAQLDPIAAGEFLDTVYKLNREMGLTVLLVEHRLEEVIPRCDKLLVMNKGGVLLCDGPRQVCDRLRAYPELLEAMPAAVRLYNGFAYTDDCPLTIREGRRWLEEHFDNHIPAPEENAYTHSDKAALELRDLWFRYDRHSPDVLRGTDLTVYEGEIFCILGGNGSGKSTAMAAMAALHRPYAGQIRVFGKKIQDYKNQSLYRDCLSMLPQDVQTVFLRSSVREELKDAGIGVEALPYDLTPLLDTHPYDLSGGEQQLVALVKVLSNRPRLLLLDEPTKGLDAHARNGIIAVLKTLKAQGMTVVVVTHDVEFAANVADRCALFFRGEVVSEDVPWAFFAENNYYTTAVNRMTRDFFDGAVTLSDAVTLCERNGVRP